MAPNITSLKARQIDAQVSRAGAQCSWKKLILHVHPALQHIAYLPLKSIQQLGLGPSAETGPDLRVPANLLPHDQLPALLHQAATNLASSSVWQQGHYSEIRFFSYKDLSSDERGPLFRALAPLRSHLVVGAKLDFGGSGSGFGRVELPALQSSLGSQLTSLHLAFCRLGSSVWLALD
jgi:hypothetical protein